MKIHPVGELVLVTRDKEEEMTKNGLYIPQNAQKKQTQGTVVAVGRGRFTTEGKLIEPSVKVGDKVLFGEWIGREIEVEGKKCLFIKDSDLFAVIE